MSSEQHLEPKEQSQGGLFNPDGSVSKDLVDGGEKKVEKSKQKEKSMTKNEEANKETGEVKKPKQEKAPEAPAKQENKTKMSVDTINRMSVTQLVKQAPRDKFVFAIAGPNPSSSELAQAEKTFAREVSYALRAFQENDFLKKTAENNKLSVINAMIDLGNSGLTLSPVLKLGYLVPMDKKVLFWASYMGKREIVMKSGQVIDTYAQLVYEGDKFEVKYGTGGYLKHETDPFAERKQEKIKGGYWYCKLTNGAEKFGTMNKEEIIAIQKRSPSANASHSPWKSDWEQMALKTIFNRGFKEMPKSGLSEDQVRALEIGDQYEEKEMKSWIKQQKTKQDSFDEDYDDNDGSVEDAEVI